jgi:hypothetical protein
MTYAADTLYGHHVTESRCSRLKRIGDRGKSPRFDDHHFRVASVPRDPEITGSWQFTRSR